MFRSPSSRSRSSSRPKLPRTVHHSVTALENETLGRVYIFRGVLGQVVGEAGVGLGELLADFCCRLVRLRRLRLATFGFVTWLLDLPRFLPSWALPRVDFATVPA